VNGADTDEQDAHMTASERTIRSESEIKREKCERRITGAKIHLSLPIAVSSYHSLNVIALHSKYTSARPVEAVVDARKAHDGEHAEAAVLELSFPHPVQGRQRVFRRHGRGPRHHLRKVLGRVL